MRKAMRVIVGGILVLSLPLSFSGAQTTYSVKVFSNATDWFKLMLFEPGSTNPIDANSLELVSTQLPIHAFELDSYFFPNGGEISFSRAPFGPTSAQVEFDVTVGDQIYVSCLKGWSGSLTIQIWQGITLITEYSNNLSGAWCFLSWVFTAELAAGGESPSLPGVTGLEQNYPNPFNPATTISYSVEQPGAVQILIYDGAGRLIRVLLDQPARAGEHQVVWDGTNDGGRRVASGHYYYQLKVGDQMMARQMILLK
jgi:hypothetical protein